MREHEELRESTNKADIMENSDDLEENADNNPGDNWRKYVPMQATPDEDVETPSEAASKPTTMKETEPAPSPRQKQQVQKPRRTHRMPNHLKDYQIG